MAFKKSKAIYKAPFIGGLFDNRLDGAIREAERAYGWSEGEFNKLQGDAGLTSLQTGPSAYEQMQLDDSSVDAQKQALNALLAAGGAGGMDASSRAALAEAAQATEQQSARERAGIMARANMAGRGTSGTSLADQLIATQAAAGRNRLAGVQAAGDAQIRGLQAYLNAGNLGGQMRGQNFQEESTKANAKDLIDRFNAQMRDQMYQNKFGLTNARTQQRIGRTQTALQGTRDSQAQAAAARGGIEKIVGTVAGAALGGPIGAGLVGGGVGAAMIKKAQG